MLLIDSSAANNWGYRHQANAFLAVLDSEAAEFHFRTFDDTQAGLGMLAHKFTGQLSTEADRLQALNDQGAGVFVVINDGGQTKDQITRVRAVFADTDGAPLAPLLEALPPHAVVQSSPGKWHVYWLVDSAFPLKLFSPIQEAIAKAYGTDPAVKDLSRVMRLPGFLHCKSEPVRVELVQVNEDLPRYSADQIVRGLGLSIAEGSPAPKLQPSATGSLVGVGDEPPPVETPENIARVKQMLDCIPAAKALGCDRIQYRNIVWAIAATGWQCGKELARSWCQSSPADYNEAHFEREWASYDPAKADGIRFGTLIHIARQYGYQEAVPAVTPLRETLNDAGNADRFIGLFGSVLRYLVELKCWIIWHQGHWKFDKKGNVLQLAMRVARSMFVEAASQSDLTLTQALSSHANRSLQQNRLEAMVAIAATSPKVAISIGDLDARPWLLQVRNGIVIDLRTGQAREARPEDLLTRVANIDYDPLAKCPLWEATVERCFSGNRTMVDFYQRAAGYTATGSTREQAFFFQYGLGANGKSTLINTLRDILAGYGAQINPEVLMAQRGGNGNNATPELARLKNIRLAAATETEDGQRLAEAFIKQATGGEPIVARELYGCPFEFIPEFKLWLSGNHRPIIRGEDHGIWRRIILIYFGATIPKDEQDKNLPDKLRAEYPGILNWIIEGALRWQQQGLKPPTEVLQEVEAYKSDMDLLKQWIEERCESRPDSFYPARAAYIDYSFWCRQGGHAPVSEVRFAQKMTERGIEKRKSNAGSRYLGICQRPGLLS